MIVPHSVAVRMAANTVTQNIGSTQRSGLSGIDNLREIDQLLVKQTVLASSVFSNYRGNKEFIIKNNLGQNVKFNFTLDEFKT